MKFISNASHYRNKVRKSLLLLLLVCSFGALSAQYTITGKVINSEGETLPGATVQLDPGSKVTATNDKGYFKLEGIPSANCRLLISFVGYQSYRAGLQLHPGTNELTITLVSTAILTEDVIVSATRAGSKTPVAYTNLEVGNRTEKMSGQDLPYLLNLTPSLVATSDAGTGIGYTNFRIRGSDANRINVTVNGIPFNDAESHDVYFVDLPDFASSTNNIQIQRGIGSSTNGAGAFGGTINLQTNNLKRESYAGWSSAAGSFGTMKNTVTVGSGLLDGKFIAEARLSQISSDGFVDRASSNLHSFYLSGGYFTQKAMLKALFFSGKEKTYQAWYGIPSSMLENDRTYNPAGIIYGSDGKISFYDNETDNYQQDHYQLHYTRQLDSRISANFSLHYTYGRGYYEEYKQEQDLSNYQMKPVSIGSSTIDQSDLVRRKWLDNDFYGAVGSVSYKGSKQELIVGTAWNTYAGDNFGKVIWAHFYGNAPINHEWYRSQGKKVDFNLFTKLNYQINSALSLYADLQYRHINYRITGIDDDLRNLNQQHLFDFFNPKIGAFYTLVKGHSLYFSIGNGQREPNRSNYTDADPAKPEPTQEKLTDLELGTKGVFGRYGYDINFYRMNYRDQLIMTGRINDVGAAIMTNVPKSYRMGIEFAGNWKIAKQLTWEHHVTVSRNKIEKFVEYVDDWDHWGEQITHDLGTTDIAFSPALTAGSNFRWTARRNWEFSFQSTYVSRQFIDNTSNSGRSLNPYFVNNLRLEHTLPQKLTKKWNFFVAINNLFDEKYESNGWVYSYYSEGNRQKEDGYFPQAGISYLLGMSIDF